MTGSGAALGRKFLTAAVSVEAEGVGRGRGVQRPSQRLAVERDLRQGTAPLSTPPTTLRELRNRIYLALKPKL